MVDLRKALRGYGAKTRKLQLLRDVPAVIELEQLFNEPGATWTPRFDELRDRTSLALFGVTERDTRPPEPHPDNFGNDGRWSRYFFSDEAFASYSSALDT